MSREGDTGLLQRQELFLDDLHRGWRDAWLLKLTDVRSQPAAHHIHRHRCLELAVTDEDDDGVEQFMGNIEEVSQAAGVTVVLPKRVLEMELLPVDALTPLLISFSSKDPTHHVFGLDDEHAVHGHHHMIDLGGAVARGDDDVVDAPVALLVEEEPHPQPQNHFSDPPFERHDPCMSTMYSSSRPTS